MAGGGAPTPARAGKRSFDFTVNLVPTIDLLSVLVGFLLVTAVWTEWARVDATQLLPKSGDGGRWWPARGTLEVVVDEAGYRVRYADDPEVVLAGGDATARLDELLA